MYKADPSRDKKSSTTTDSANAHPLPQASDDCLLVARRRTCSSPTFLLRRASDTPRFPYDFGFCSSANFSADRRAFLLTALGSGHVTGASSAVVAPLQRLVATGIAAVLLAPVTPGSSHCLCSSTEEAIVKRFKSSCLSFSSWFSCVWSPLCYTLVFNGVSRLVDEHDFDAFFGVVRDKIKRS